MCVYVGSKQEHHSGSVSLYLITFSVSTSNNKGMLFTEYIRTYTYLQCTWLWSWSNSVCVHVCVCVCVYSEWSYTSTHCSCTHPPKYVKWGITVQAKWSWDGEARNTKHVSQAISSTQVLYMNTHKYFHDAILGRITLWILTRLYLVCN